MTTIETPDVLVADAAAPWPPKTCPGWCAVRHEPGEPVDERSCFTRHDGVELSLPNSNASRMCGMPVADLTTSSGGGQGSREWLAWMLVMR